jgi:hypothetical protein
LGRWANARRRQAGRHAGRLFVGQREEALPIWRRFEELTGVKVEYVRGSDTQLIARMAIESRLCGINQPFEVVAITMSLQKWPVGVKVLHKQYGLEHDLDALTQEIWDNVSVSSSTLFQKNSGCQKALTFAIHRQGSFPFASVRWHQLDGALSYVVDGHGPSS